MVGEWPTKEKASRRRRKAQRKRTLKDRVTCIRCGTGSEGYSSIGTRNFSSAGANSSGRESVTVHLRLFGEFREYLPEGAAGGRATIVLPDGATVFTLVDQLGLPYEAEEGVLVAAVNDEVADLK